MADPLTRWCVLKSANRNGWRKMRVLKPKQHEWIEPNYLNLNWDKPHAEMVKPNQEITRDAFDLLLHCGAYMLDEGSNYESVFLDDEPRKGAGT
jgi:hypothetical protein